MDYEAVGNSCIRSGASLLALGAFLTSLGWFLLGTYRRTDQWLKGWAWLKSNTLRKTIIFICGVFLLIVGPRMIGEGGTLTTKGWNFLNSHEEKQALIQAVFNEWATNTLLGRRLPYDLNDEEVGRIHLLYPVFRSSALGEALTSSLFTLDNTTEGKLIAQIMRYEQSISGFNYLLRQYDYECSRKAVGQEQRRAKYQELNDSPLFKQYLACHRATGELLKSDYSWTFSGRIGQPWEQLMKKQTRTAQKDESVK